MSNRIDEYILAKKEFDKAKNNYNLIYAGLWLHTDWEKEFPKKPSIKDREQWIVFREGISQLFEELVTAEYEKELQKGLYDIMMKED